MRGGQICRQLLADVGEHFWGNADSDLTVTDASGLILFSVGVIGIGNARAPGERRRVGLG